MLVKRVNNEIGKLVKEEITVCDQIKDFDKRLACKSDLLYQVTEVQDNVNLNVMKDFRETDPRCSEDERWIPVHLVDNANAIILGVSRNRYQPQLILRERYVGEKVDALGGKWSHINNG